MRLVVDQPQDLHWFCSWSWHAHSVSPSWRWARRMGTSRWGHGEGVVNGGFHTWGIPKWMVYDEKTYHEMDDLGAPALSETTIPYTPKHGGKKTCENHGFLWISTSNIFKPLPGMHPEIWDCVKKNDDSICQQWIGDIMTYLLLLLAVMSPAMMDQDARLSKNGGCPEKYAITPWGKEWSQPSVALFLGGLKQHFMDLHGRF